MAESVVEACLFVVAGVTGEAAAERPWEGRGSVVHCGAREAWKSVWLVDVCDGEWCKVDRDEAGKEKLASRFLGAGEDGHEVNNQKHAVKPE